MYICRSVITAQIFTPKLKSIQVKHCTPEDRDIIYPLPCLKWRIYSDKNVFIIFTGMD